MENKLIVVLSIALASHLSAQTTVTLTNGQDSATAYDTTGNDTTFTIASGSATQSGVISGSGTLIKTGAGLVEFTSTNSFTGAIDIQAGTLALSSDLQPWWIYQTSGISFGDTATASLNISGSALLMNSGTITLGDTSTGHGTLSLSNRTSAFFSMQNSGDVIVGNAGSGTINLTSGGWLSVVGSTRLGAGIGGIGHVLVDSGSLNTHTVKVAEGADSVASLTITNGSVVTQGSLELGAGAGSSGQVTILNGGTLFLQDDASGDALRIGSGSGTVSIDGGTLKHVGFAGIDFTTSVPIDISGNTTFDTSGREMRLHGLVSGPGALEVIGGGQLTLTADNAYAGGTTVSSTFLRLGAGGASGSVTGDITNNGMVIFDRSDDYTFNGVISGTGRLRNEGHIVRLANAQTYTGDTELRSGFLVLPTDIDQALSAATRVSISTGATLDISNRKLTVSGLTGGGQVYSFGGSAGELTVNTAAGPTQNFYGSLGSSYPNFSLVKTGDGTLILSGTNTYTGSTTINAGTLIVNGSTGGGLITVEQDGTLSGTGTLGGEVTVAGTLAPGQSPGTLTFEAHLSLQSTATVTLEITGTDPNEFDVLSGNGGNTLTLAGTLILDNTGYTATLGDTITIFADWGTITGSFDSISGTDLGDGLQWDTSNLYSTGSLNVIPEPSTAILFGLPAIAFALRRWRK